MGTNSAFSGSLTGIFLTVKLISKVAHNIERLFPKKRMFIFEWIPLLSFYIYFVGFFSAIYLIIRPSREIFLSLVLSGLFSMGFALKDTISSIVAGVTLLLGKPFQVGDKIVFKEIQGEVLSIGLSSVKILTLDESTVTIPNNRFINEVVS